MFPGKLDADNMKTRNKVKYEVQSANKGRLQKSPIIDIKSCKMRVTYKNKIR